MNDQTDAQLLRAYAEHRSEPAFAELVRRHVDLVYSAALRMVCDSHLAQDVTQGVFVALAKNAAQLTDHAVLSGWLHRTAQNIAAQTVRTDVRRRAREQEAAAMNELLSAEPDASWDHIAPHLDAALGELSEPDRDAVLLRYFEGKSAREMAQTLGVSDDAAQKRVSRAVERLREFFAKRGVTVGASGLVVVISANAVQAAPVGLAVTISAAVALAGTTIATTATGTTKLIAMTALQKTLVTATVAVLAGASVYEACQTSRLRDQIQTLQQQPAPLVQQNQQLQRELDDATNRLAALLAESERLKPGNDKTELLRLRGEVTRLQNESRQLTQERAGNAKDPTMLAAQAWVGRAKLLKQRFEEWPGKTTPELQLLNEQDWLNEVANRELDSEETCRKAMSHLRYTAKGKFAEAVNQALDGFAKSNKQAPSDVSQLKPYLKPPVDSVLDGYEIAKSGWVHPPQPSSPNSKNAETWALIMKGSFTPDGIAIRDGSYLGDPEYDMTVVIYRGGHYGYGPDRPSK